MDSRSESFVVRLLQQRRVQLIRQHSNNATDTCAAQGKSRRFRWWTETAFLSDGKLIEKCRIGARNYLSRDREAEGFLSGMVEINQITQIPPKGF